MSPLSTTEKRVMDAAIPSPGSSSPDLTVVTALIRQENDKLLEERLHAGRGLPSAMSGLMGRSEYDEVSASKFSHQLSDVSTMARLEGGGARGRDKEWGGRGGGSVGDNGACGCAENVGGGNRHG